MSSGLPGRQNIDALQPPGPLWKPEVNKDLDKLLDALGASSDTAADFLADLVNVRNPNKTPILEDLEREYGIKPNSNVLMTDRIARLTAKVYRGEKIDSPDDLRDALDTAGFDLQVHLNDPAVDPDIFLDQIFIMVAGGDNAYAGHIPVGGPPSDAYAGRLGGEWLVNPEILIQSAAIEMQAGGEFGYADLPEAVAGYFTDFNSNELEYDTPPAIYWPLVFFVGGDATRDGTGALTAIATGEVPNERRTELLTTILSIKPEMAWCGLIVTYI